MAKEDKPAAPAFTPTGQPVNVPPGYRLVPDQATFDEARTKEREALVAELAKGITVRSQEACDKLFPAGDKVFLVELKDGNGQPALRVRADSEFDARARYDRVCGIQTSDPDKDGQSRYAIAALAG